MTTVSPHWILFKTKFSVCHWSPLDVGQYWFEPVLPFCVSMSKTIFGLEQNRVRGWNFENNCAFDGFSVSKTLLSPVFAGVLKLSKTIIRLSQNGFQTRNSANNWGLTNGPECSRLYREVGMGGESLIASAERFPFVRSGCPQSHSNKQNGFAYRKSIWSRRGQRERDDYHSLYTVELWPLINT